MGDFYNGTIPQFPYGTTVSYKIIVENRANNTVTSEELGQEFQYYVVPEFQVWLVLPMFMMTSLVVVAVFKKRKFRSVSMLG